MSRFDYVKYDAVAIVLQAAFKEQFEIIESLAGGLGSERWKDAMLTQLEFAYMCAGKAIRDDQIARNGSAELQEERKDG